MKTIWLTALAAALAVLALVSVASADEAKRCTGELSGDYGNVVVPTGEDCTLDGANISGNLEIQAGADSVRIEDTTIRGNVRATDASEVAIEGSTIQGNLELVAATGSVRVCDSTVQGNLSVRDASAEGDVVVGEGDDCGGNEVGGNFELLNNAADSVTGEGNDVGGNETFTGNTDNDDED